MALPKSKRIADIARIESRKEREAARLLAEARAKLDETQRRLDELRRYRDEYLGRLRGDLSATVSVAHLKHFHLFLGRLDEGVAHAEGSVAQAGARWEQARSLWSAQRSRLAALGKVADRYDREALRARSRRDQRAVDDRASSAPRVPDD